MIEIIGEDVKTIRNLQNMLRTIGLYENILPEVIVDGIFDDITEKAVVDFQKREGLAPTGIVDIVTFEKIVDKYKKTDNTAVGLRGKLPQKHNFGI